MEINNKKAKILFGILMAGMMALAMSFVMVWINVGLNSNFFAIWMKSFGLGFLVAVPTSIIAAPIAQKLVHKLT